ncbi:DUF2373 domain containing protein [Nitzschia inconspicua]|uniref:DUF2373 domain containing protein n=1 Tax=Nitzschia inconspicua TaxID=303405 RepID=A0A9K3KU66_9STRA|nr:DUF2373 domain containing protein [Nitzschia inconspicua]
MGKKNKSKALKKKRVSKHMLKSKERTTNHSVENDALDNAVTEQITPPVTTTPNSKLSRKKDSHFKDPEEAASYLSAWKASQSDSGPNGATDVWKFNKNTQSWLIRHMYEVDKVSKGTFVLLLEYLEGLQGSKTKSWILSEAARRARRYKEYERRTVNDNNENDEKDDGDTKDKKIESATESAEMSPEDLENEEERWKKLNDHDKRKEYKRARKVIEVIKA